MKVRALPATLGRVQARTNAGTFTWGVGGELRWAEPPAHPLCPPADWNRQRMTDHHVQVFTHTQEKRTNTNTQRLQHTASLKLSTEDAAPPVTLVCLTLLAFLVLAFWIFA